jgi:Tol biopolymer transport system component
VSRSISRHMEAAIGLVVWAFAAGMSCAYAENSTSSAGREILIAIPEFAASPQVSGVATLVRQAVKEKLSHLNAYALSDAADVASTIGFNRAPDFVFWQSRHIQLLIAGQVSFSNDGRLNIAARVWNVPEQTQVGGWQFVSSEWQPSADALADEIIKRLNGRDSASDN